MKKCVRCGSTRVSKGHNFVACQKCGYLNLTDIPKDDYKDNKEKIRENI